MDSVIVGGLLRLLLSLSCPFVFAKLLSTLCDDLTLAINALRTVSINREPGPDSDFGVSGAEGCGSLPRKSLVFSFSSSVNVCNKEDLVRSSSLANFSAL